MAVQNGKDLLIKLDMVGDGSFQTIAGLRATRISLPKTDKACFVTRRNGGCDEPGKPRRLA